MTTVKHVAALISVVALLAASTVVFAQTPSPTQADFDRCNKLAQAKMKSPSASPGTGAATTPGSSAATAKPGTDTSTSGGASAPTADPTLPGIAAAGVSDPTYQQAYRDCIKGK